MKKILFSIYCFAFINALQAQTGLTLLPSTSFLIQGGTVLSVDGLALTPSGNYFINSPNSLTKNLAISNPSPNVSIKRVFNFSNILNTYSGAIGIYYADSELNGIAEGGLTLNNFNGVNWEDYSSGYIISKDGANNFVVTSGLVGRNLSELTLADLLYSLPIRWGAISAKRKDNSIFIKWNCQEQSNIRQFDIERSDDGLNWVKINTEPIPVGLQGNQDYEFQDLTLSKNKTFYHIVETEIDDKFSYSPVAVVNALQSDATIQVYPNPAHSELKIKVEKNSVKILSITLYDIHGQAVYCCSDASNQYSIDLSDLPNGSYFLQILFENQTMTNKKIIKN